VLSCTFCDRSLLVMPPMAGAPPAPDTEPVRDPELARIELAGQRFAVLGRLAQGESTEVFLARTDRRLSERVVLKVLRAPGDADLLTREWTALEALHQSDAQGAPYFTLLLPQPVAHGLATLADGGTSLATAFRWRSGFVHTLDDVCRVYPRGVEPKVGVWLWKRLLELLGWVHRAGFAHGALVPRHLLVHPKDHGVVLCGWSCARRWGLGDPLPARVAEARECYPEALWQGGPSTVETDLAMAARCVIRALGGEAGRGEPPRSTPEPLARLLRAHARLEVGRAADAWELKEQVVAAAREALGHTGYQPLHMPGWPARQP
jgi:hypothetical protein